MTCWLCFGTGRVIDLRQVGKREYEPGPDHDKPCPSGCEIDEQANKGPHTGRTPTALQGETG